MLTCFYGTPWLDHFNPPIGTGKGCSVCDRGQYRLDFEVEP